MVKPDSAVTEYPMDFERLLAPGCTELPACQCGKEMHVARTYSIPDTTKTHIRVYTCSACRHELRLTVWGAECVADDVSQLPTAVDQGHCRTPSANHNP